MTPVDKFNIHWQIVRCEAKMLVTVDDKCQHVLRFLDKNPCIQNFHRVLNWFMTSKLAYSPLDQSIFEFYQRQIFERSYAGRTQDMDNSFDGIHTSELRMVLKDLQKRTYGFQFGGRAPESHKRFVERLEQELIERENKG